ncbi:unnamed protein product, partial [Darwinula stevensoni]
MTLGPLGLADASPVLSDLDGETMRRFDHAAFRYRNRKNCPVDMTLQCYTFQLPATLLCRRSAFTYNGKRYGGRSSQFLRRDFLGYVQAFSGCGTHDEMLNPS